MGISSITNRQTYIGDATSTIFPFAFEFFTPNDLNVYLWDTFAGSSYPQVLNTNYTISGQINNQGIYPAGGNVVMASSIPTNLMLVITRNPAQIQNFILSQNGPINSIGLTNQLDYLTLLVQRLQDEVSRAVTLPDGMGFINGSSFSPLLPSQICLASSAMMVLVTNSGATGFQLMPYQGSSASGGGSINFPVLVSQGGTGQVNPWLQGGVLYAPSGTTTTTTSGGTPGYVLTANGSSAPTWNPSLASGSTNLTNQVQGILPVANGGTNISALNPQYGLLYANTPSQVGIIPPVAAGMYLQSAGSSSPVWAASTSSGSTSLTNQVSGILPIANGGTGTNGIGVQYSVLYMANALQMTSIAPSTPGLVLTTQGSSAPTWAAVSGASGSTSLTNQVSGVLPIANGGTNISTLPFLGSVIWASSATSFGVVPEGIAGQVLQYNGSSAPSWVNQTGGATGSTSLTNQVSGVLPVANGGNGVATLAPQFGIIYMSSLTQMAVIPSAAAGQILTANGSSAPTFQPASFALTAPTRTIVNSSMTGTYSPPSNSRWLKVTIIGGGGAGGGVSSTTAQAGGAPGGGGGGTVMKWLQPTSSSYSYVIGAGGPSGVAGTNAGQSGSSSIFGSSVLLTAMIAGGGGGGAGAGSTSSLSIGGGPATGGTASGGDINAGGGGGTWGLTATGTVAIGGQGGGTSIAGMTSLASATVTQGGNTVAGNLYGGGGGGGQQVNNGGAQSGGPGANGILIVEEYYQ